jgi:hypothetical protein
MLLIAIKDWLWIMTDLGIIGDLVKQPLLFDYDFKLPWDNAQKVHGCCLVGAGMERHGWAPHGSGWSIGLPGSPGPVNHLIRG